MVYSKLRANLEIIAEALEGSPATDTAGYAVESCAKTFRRLWCDMNNLLVDMIDREKELVVLEGTIYKLIRLEEDTLIIESELGEKKRILPNLIVEDIIPLNLVKQLRLSNYNYDRLRLRSETIRLRFVTLAIA